MAGELKIRLFDADLTINAKIWNEFGKVWDGSDFVDYATADLTDYIAEVMTEQGTSSKMYVGDMPSGIDAGRLFIEYTIQSGGSPSESDAFAGEQHLDWDGQRPFSLSTIVSQVLYSTP